MQHQPIVLDKVDSQFLLYAKHHFKYPGTNAPRQRSVEDVRALVAYRCGIPAESITDFDILIVLTHLISELKLERVVAGQRFMSTVIFGGSYGRPVRLVGEPENTPLERFVFAVLDEISIMQVWEGDKQYIKYEPLDPNVFPNG